MTLPPHDALSKASAEIDHILARERDQPPAVSEADAPAAEPNRVIFWYYGHPLLAKAFPPGRPGDFEQIHPGVSLDAQFIGEWPVAIQKLTVSLAAGDTPDIAVVKRSWLARLIPSGRIAALDELLPAPLTDDFDARVKASMEVDGRLYALPADGFCSVLYLNAAFVATAPRTWDDLVRVGKSVTSMPNGPLAIGYLPYLEALWSAGGDVVVKDGSGLSAPAAREALDFILALRDAGLLRPTLYMDEASAMEAFLRGHVAMTVASSAYMPRLSGLPFKAEVAAVPGKSGAVSRYSDNALVVFKKYSKAKAPAIAKVLDYVTGGSVLGPDALRMGSIPVRTSVDAEAPDGLKTAFASGRFTPLIPAWSEVEYTLERYLRLGLLWSND